MLRIKRAGLLFGLLAMLSHESTAETNWPEPNKLAVSLSYDDALASQLDHAAPALKKFGVTASFYPKLSEPVFNARLAEWRALAEAGHELGNHTLFHPCSASGENRDWVPAHQNLDTYVLEQIRIEVETANAFLKSLDGQTERTYTPPCLDTKVKDGNYIEHVSDLFVSVKSAERLPDGWVRTELPENMTGAELIALVEESAKEHKLLNLIFHGIGGDYMSIAPAAHEELLRYLTANPDKYWVDSYINIMRRVAATVPAAPPSDAAPQSRSPTPEPTAPAAE